jgi:hypothetical protein
MTHPIEQNLLAVVVGRKGAFIGGCLTAVPDSVAPFRSTVVFVDSRFTERTVESARTYAVWVVELNTSAPLLASRLC